VAKPNCFYSGGTEHITREYPHWVGIVEKQGPRRHFFNFPGKIQHYREGSQGPHDSAYAQGVTYGLQEAVLAGNFKIRNCTGFVPSHLDGIDDKTGASQGVPPLGRPQIGFDNGLRTVDVSVDGTHHGVAFLKPRLVNIVKGDLAERKFWGTKYVSQNFFCEYAASRAQKGYFYHETIIQAFWKTSTNPFSKQRCD
jgi:hypothetical protein